MAFFGLTYLGYQDPLSDYVVDKDLLPDYDVLPYVLREHPYEKIKHHYFYTKEFRFDRPWFYNGARRPSSKRKGPFAVYRQPLTTNEQYGWWQKDLKKGELIPKWAYIKRRVRVESEITKWADALLKTNPNILLF